MWFEAGRHGTHRLLELNDLVRGGPATISLAALARLKRAFQGYGDYVNDGVPGITYVPWTSDSRVARCSRSIVI